MAGIDHRQPASATSLMLAERRRRRTWRRLLTQSGPTIDALAQRLAVRVLLLR